MTQPEAPPAGDAGKLVHDPATLPSARLYKLVAGTVVPRPIALVSTVSRTGVRNLAPFSFFNVVSHAPPVVMFSAGLRDGRMKDTLANARHSGEFVVNLVNEPIARAMSVCAGNYAPDESEFAASGLTPVAATLVGAPLVAESPVNFECRVTHVMPIVRSEYTVVFGEVVRIHVERALVGDDGRVDARRLRAVARMAGNAYATTRELFSLDYDTFTQIR